MEYNEEEYNEEEYNEEVYNEEVLKGLDENTKEVINRFSNSILGYSEVVNSKKVDDHISYVYALCERIENGESAELIPFYIGEGQNGRVWAHECEAKDIERAKELINQEKCECTEDDTKENKIAELSAKIERIKNIEERRKNGEKVKVEKIIIKWGMTKEEAFMAESALINLLSMGNLKFDLKFDKLTNIANGHSSEAERKSRKGTKARTIEEFMRDVAMETVEFEELLAKGVKALLININRTYSDIEYSDEKKRDKAIKETCCGCWDLNEKNDVDYVFAVFGSRIVGVYKACKDENNNNIIKRFIDTDTFGYPPRGDDTVEVRISDDDYAQILRGIAERENKGRYAIEYDDLTVEEKELIKKNYKVNNKKEFDNILNRKFIVIEDIQSDGTENELDKYCMAQKNKMITFSEGYVKFLKDRKGKIKKEYEKQYEEWKNNSGEKNVKKGNFNKASVTIFSQNPLRYVRLNDPLIAYLGGLYFSPNSTDEQKSWCKRIFDNNKIKEKKIKKIVDNEGEAIKKEAAKKLNKPKDEI